MQMTCWQFGLIVTGWSSVTLNGAGIAAASYMKVDWLADRLAGWLTDRLSGWLTGWLAGWKKGGDAFVSEAVIVAIILGWIGAVLWSPGMQATCWPDTLTAFDA